MENKKTIIGIIIVIILIIGLVGITYLYYQFNQKQLEILTEESNKLLQLDIATEEIEEEIKTKKDFSIVEKTMKEYLLKMRNDYKQLESMYSDINPNNIFTSKNVEDKDFKEIENFIEEYQKNADQLVDEYKKLTEEENITKEIKEKEFSKNQEYYIELYNSVMLNDVMKEKYDKLESKIEKKRDELSNKLEKIDKIKEFLNENKKYWNIKEEKIQFTNINIMTQYYSLLNQLIED